MTHPPQSCAADTAPAPLVLPDARERIRANHRKNGTRIAVLDDDPTGSQAVHGVEVVTAFDEQTLAAGLAVPGATCFVLTNSRSLGEPDAAALSHRIGGTLLGLGARWGVPVQVVSRSDSTLRGHVFAEVGALDAARRAVLGRGYDGVLFAPAFFEAGRRTAGDVHRARVDGVEVPVGETEFARDATFGYTASNLREFLAEKSRGALAASDAVSVTIDDIRLGGPERVTQILLGVTGGAFVVVNALSYADLEVVVLGLLEAEREGRAFLHRTGPSFVRALAGVEPRGPVTAADLSGGGRLGHGLVVVGSHVNLTTRQVARARRLGGFEEVELDVAAVIDPVRRQRHVAVVAERVRAELARRDVLLCTSRGLRRGADAAGSLDIARRVSDALVEVVASVRSARPAWVVAKGGITSHDVAVRGLSVRRAEVVGQLLPGMISALRPIDAAPEAIGMPYVVFAGNVGDDDALAHVIGTLRRPHSEEVAR